MYDNKKLWQKKMHIIKNILEVNGIQQELINILLYKKDLILVVKIKSNIC